MPLVDDSGKYELSFHSPISEDREQLLDEYEMGVDVWLTKNEIRDREGLPPVEGGDQLYVGSTVIATGSVEDKPKSINSKVKKVSKKVKTASKNDTKSVVDAFIATMPKSVSYRIMDTETKTKFINEWKNGVLNNASKLKAELKKFFDAQEKEVLANLKDEMKGLEPDEFVMKGMNDILFDQGDAVSTGINMVTPFIKDYLTQAGITAIKLAGGTDFNSTTNVIKNWVTDRAKFFSDSINSTTRDALSKTIQDGINNSESLQQISERVAGVYNQATDSRMDMIARTEVHAASVKGTVEGYTQAGVERMQWTVVDPCDICAENADAIVDIGDAFPNGDTDPSDEHPNCMCQVVPVFNSEDSDDNQ